jgi:hypothetical protein
LRERATDIRELTFVDAADRRVAGMSTRIFNADGDIEIMRGDLAEVLYEATADDVEFTFGDSIAAITQRPDAVERRNSPQRAATIGSPSTAMNKPCGPR